MKLPAALLTVVTLIVSSAAIGVAFVETSHAVLNSATSSHSQTRAKAPNFAFRHPALKCSPAPCALPNVLVSSYSAANTMVVANPSNPKRVLATSSGSNRSCPYYSKDGGSEWYQGTPYGCPGGVVAFGEGKTAYQVSSNGSFSNTPDNGETWSSSIQAVTPLFANGATLQTWIASDTSSSSPYSGNIYIVATQIDDEDVRSEISVTRSADGGLTWQPASVDTIQVKPKLDYYPRIAVGSDGTVYATWQRCEMLGKNINCGGTEAKMFFSKSTDGGVTWSTPVVAAKAHLVPDRCDCTFFGSLPHTKVAVGNPPVIAVDNSQGSFAGTLYLTVYNWTGKQMQVEVVSSHDGGATWGNPVPVAGASKNDQFFPTLTVSGDGTLGVSWLDRRNDRNDVNYQPFAAISTDGGNSFSTNYPLTRKLSNPYYAYNQDMGDYIGSSWAGKSLLVSWPDTRYSVMQDFVGGLLTQ